ncbi:MAG: hypothetical protein GAK28_02529 [Luteibacter sp.]|uniref:hypothetical protein n=1 Tax=Luteibacter sp. TaxID=1886636 RepID=UPI0013861FAB|nr:hypothetical protein [Luteibacter sp.]KAF1006511.1 MAG: hypothetical protein GAK28_02529 [Luteibacter sp.]
MRLLAFWICALCSAASIASSPADACFKRGSGGGEICPVAFTTLIARSELFDRKPVFVRGFYVGGVRPMLFASRDAYEMRDASAGILVMGAISEDVAKALKPYEGHYVYLEGRYIAEPLDVTGYGSFRSAGALTAIKGLGQAEGQPWPTKKGPEGE